ncbi:MAG: hypothetical protein ABSB91_02795 [Sedimentisphaerales bacterium]|jgi:hypothetical protein
MKGSKMTVGKFVKYSVLSICTVALWLALCPPALGETLGEAVTTMEIQQELMGSEAQKRIAEPNLKTTGSEEKEETAPKAAPKSPSKAKDMNAAKVNPKPLVAEKTADTNAPGPDINDFNDYKQEINRIDIEARGEESKWLGKLDKKADLAKAMDDVVVAELKFLRKMTDTEGSQKTVEAIDLILKRRQERLAKLITKLEDEAKTERRERRPPRLGGAGAGEQGQAGRPQRRTREPIQPANTNTNTEGQQQP